MCADNCNKFFDGRFAIQFGWVSSADFESRQVYLNFTFNQRSEFASTADNFVTPLFCMDLQMNSVIDCARDDFCTIRGDIHKLIHFLHLCPQIKRA